MSRLKSSIDSARTEERTHKTDAKIACAAVIVIFAAIVVSVAVLYNLRGATHKKLFTVKSSKEPACSGLTCSNAENILIKFMNHTADPCNNFYNFVCANYQSSSSSIIGQMTVDMLREVQTKLSSTNIRNHGQSAVEKAVGLYAACKNKGLSGTNEEEALKMFFKRLGLSVVKDTQGDAVDKIILLALKYNLQSVLSLSLTDASLYRERRQMKISFGSPQMTWFRLRQSLSENLRATFYRRFVDVLTERKTNLDAIKAINDAETTASVVLKTVQQKHKDQAVYVRASVIHTYTPHVSSRKWGRLISTHSGNVYQTSDQLAANLRALAYLDILYRKIGNVGVNLLVIWEILRQLGPLTSPSIAGLYEQSVRRQLCLDAVIQAMEIPALSVYLFNAVPQAAIRSANAMLKRIQASVLQEINDANWLDDFPRSVALHKVQSMTKYVGYPTHLRSEEELNRFYENYPDVQDKFFGHWLNALRRNMEWLIRDKKHFVFNLTPVNAKYVPMRNIMVILASIIRPPVYALEGPEGFNYGGLGHVIGHEIMHAFDVEGSKRDAAGRLTRWWTPRAWKYFENKTLCLRTSHQTASQGRARSLDATLDSENMADFLSLSFVYKAFQKYQDNRRFPNLTYNSRQLFFIASCLKLCSASGGSANRYTAPQQRCNVPLMNTVAFAKAFHCARNSPMNPANNAASGRISCALLATAGLNSKLACILYVVIILLQLHPHSPLFPFRCNRV